jgi:hypothetical protein
MHDVCYGISFSDGLWRTAAKPLEIHPAASSVGGGENSHESSQKQICIGTCAIETG